MLSVVPTTNYSPRNMPVLISVFFAVAFGLMVQPTVSVDPVLPSPPPPAMYHGIDEYSEFYNLPPLPFKFGSMEPQFDAPTMKIHYIEVHANFTKTMNRLLKEWRNEVRKCVK